MKKNIYWLLPMLTCIVPIVASVFLPGLTYIYPNGQKVSFNVFSFGVYPIIAPIAMILCMITVTKTQENASGDPSCRKGERIDSTWWKVVTQHY